jgi:hypothetical protein
MKNKNFNHKDFEECCLCNKEINTLIEKWIALVDFDKDKIEKLKFYHRFCLNDLLLGQGKVISSNFQDEVKKAIGSLLKNIKPAVDNLRENSEEKVFEIKA